jgi:hypothetical protein
MIERTGKVGRPKKIDLSEVIFKEQRKHIDFDTLLKEQENNVDKIMMLESLLHELEEKNRILLDMMVQLNEDEYKQVFKL